ncbi:MAG: TolC family protein [Bacteroidales bacterium]|nr:TolC family protein [Bacteroidales bacterium]
MKKYGLIIATAVLFSITSNAQDNAKTVFEFTLEDCIGYALDKNYSRQSLILSEESNQVSYQQSKDSRLPSVNASVSENFTNSKDDSSMGGSASISANMTLYQGGYINNTIEQSRLQMEQATHKTTQYENELKINILQAFLSVLGNDELLKFQYSVAEASEEQLKQGEELFKAGNMIESDYLLLDAQYASDRNNIVDTEITRDNNILTLKNLLSMDPENELRIIHPDTSIIENIIALPSKQEVTERSLNYLPDMKISQYNVDIAGVSVDLARADYYPTISLGASIGTGHTDFSKFGTQLSDRLNEQVGVTVSIPIFNKNRTKSNVTKSRIALQQAELDQKQTELTIRQNITQEYQNVVSAYNKYNVTDIKQKAYQKTFDAYRVQFNVGSITAVDLLQQQNNYISSLNDYIQSKYNFILLRKVLDVYMGEDITI